MLISQVLAPIALRNPGNIAFRYLGRGTTYKEFWETANRVSYFLLKEVGPGNRVALWMSDGPTIPIAFIALANTKNCTVPLNPTAPLQENLFKLKNAGVTHVLCTSDYAKEIKHTLSENGLGALKIIDMEGKRCVEFDTTYTPPAAHPPREEDDILLFYTSGTFGRLKGCLFNHKAVTHAMNAVKLAYKATPTDVFYNQLHYGSAFGFIHFLLAPLQAGAGVFFSDEKDFRFMLPAMLEGRVSRLAPIPWKLLEMMKFAEAEKLPFNSVRYVILNGARLSDETWEHLKGFGTIKVIPVYGPTEYLGTVAMGTGDLPADPAKPAMIGPPILGAKVRLLDENNEEIDKHKAQIGHLAVTGPSLMTKYLDLPEEQKVAMRGTWLHTGDLAGVSVSGSVFFLERKADVIPIAKGGKVFPAEIEPLLRQLPQVKEAACIQVHDKKDNPITAVVLVRHPQMSLNERDVMLFLGQKIPVEKRPQRVLFADTLPHTAHGAINRAKLRATYDRL